MVASHLVIGDEMVSFVTDVTPFFDDLCDVMELNPFYDECFCHGWNPIFVIISRLSWLLTAPLTAFVMCDDQI
jgi:hypothetical protein